MSRPRRVLSSSTSRRVSPATTWWAGAVASSATRKVGHAGTLDPMATGVLVVGIERATKILGLLTATDEVVRRDDPARSGHRHRRCRRRCAAERLGGWRHRRQIARCGRPRCAARSSRSRRRSAPSRSAASGPTGSRARARPSNWPARSVRVDRFDVLAIRRLDELVDVDVEVDCSSGTYIRALARDVGAALGVGGHLTALRRTRVGRFGLDEARTLDELAEAAAAVLHPRRGVPAGVSASRPDRRRDRGHPARPGADTGRHRRGVRGDSARRAGDRAAARRRRADEIGGRAAAGHASVTRRADTNQPRHADGRAILRLLGGVSRRPKSLVPPDFPGQPWCPRRRRDSIATEIMPAKSRRASTRSRESRLMPTLSK